ncbi:MAG TPA: hypothetical protein VFJ85_14620 [Acidimicrobiales bacterium]|nr:hypothetical protein [Acidimicrobiales bacterium]
MAVLALAAVLPAEVAAASTETSTPPPPDPPVTASPITIPSARGLKGDAGNTGDAISAQVSLRGAGQPAEAVVPAATPTSRPPAAQAAAPADSGRGCYVPLTEGGGPCEPDPTPTRTRTIPAPQLASEVAQRTQLPLPEIHTSPPDGAEQLVNLPTWMWVTNWRPSSASATAGSLTVTVTAKPRRVVWRMGAGQPVACLAGKAWNPALREEDQSSDCTFTYLESSAHQPRLRYPASATMVFDISWSATNGESGSLGQASTTTNFSMRVAEGQALIGG